MPKKPANKDAKGSEISDVSKPGSTPASPNSRPIIVGHQSALGKDPLLAKSQEDDLPKNNSADLKLTKQKKITPLTDQDKVDEPQADQTEPKDEQPEQQAEQDSSSPNSSAAIDALAGEVDAKAEAKQQSKAEKEQDEKIQALIDSKRYHLPITEGGRKAVSERIATWLLVFMIVAAAAAWLAIDAGYLDIGIDLPYDLIKN